MRLEEWFKHLEDFEQTGKRRASPRSNREREAAQIEIGLSDGRTFHTAPEMMSRSVSELGASNMNNTRVGRPLSVKSSPDSSHAALPAARETREQLLARLLDPVLTLDEAAKVLNVCPTTVRRYTNRGILQHYRTTGNQRRFRLSQVLRFLEQAAGGVGAGTLSGALRNGGPERSKGFKGHKTLARFDHR